MTAADKLTKALRDAWMAGSDYGHNATVEGHWTPKAVDLADEYVAEILAAYEREKAGQDKPRTIPCDDIPNPDYLF